MATMSFETKFYWTIIGCLVTYILFLQKCSTLHECPEDTTTVYKQEIKYDTVEFPKYVVKEIKVKVPTPITVYDTVINKEVNYYTENYADSLIEGQLCAKVDGTLVSWGFNYTPLFPKYITKTVINSTLTTVHDTVESTRARFFLGLQARVGQGMDYDMYPFVSLQKNNLLFNLGYSPLKKAGEFGVGIKLGKRNKTKNKK
jgi:hypothetical protein